MGLTLSFILLFVGLVLLWKTGDLSVTQAIRVSVIFRIHSFMIGFVIFAIATGLPEMSSAVISSLKKVPTLSSGNLIGSSFVNLTLQLGIASILARELLVDPNIRNKLIRTSCFISAIFSTLLFFPSGPRYLGIILICLYIISFIWFPKKKIFCTEEIKEVPHEKQFFSPKVDVLLKLGGSLALLVLSAWLTVQSAISIAQLLNVPAMFIGGTVVAVGTALPELTLEIHAIKRKEFGLALGDIFGSSLFNISMVLGMLIAFNPDLNLKIAKIVIPFLTPVLAIIFYRLFRKQAFMFYDGIGLIVIFTLYILRITAMQFLT